MRISRLSTICLISALVLLVLPIYGTRCQNYNRVEYKVEVHSDKSADWMVTRVSSIDTDIDVTGFQERVMALIDVAANSTQREMALDEDSLQLIDDISWETQTRKTVYAFKWQNYSIIENEKLTFGDVFRVKTFFRQLYGDGALQINYPSTYSILSVSPRPDDRDDTAQMLKWLGTEYFINGEQEVVLADKSQNTNGDWWQQYNLLAAILAIAIASLLAGVYVLRRRKLKAQVAATASLAGVSLIESDEERIINLMRSSGGKMRQSAITEQCKFSKAKTSQLLASLEHKGAVTRYKRGRDKIVTLKERATGEHS